MPFSAYSRNAVGTSILGMPKVAKSNFGSSKVGNSNFGMSNFGISKNAGGIVAAGVLGLVLVAVGAVAMAVILIQGGFTDRTCPADVRSRLTRAATSASAPSSNGHNVIQLMVQCNMNCAP